MSLSIFARGFSLLFIFSLILLIYAKTPEEQVPFDLKQVIEQVTHHPRVNGNTIEIDGKYYEARFEKDGFFLKERNSKRQFRINLDEETGNIKITDDEVQYNSTDGILSIKGKNQGLQFRKEIKDNGHRSTKDGFRYRFRTEGKEVQIDEISVTDASGNRFIPQVSKKLDRIDILIPETHQSKLKFPLTLFGEFMIDTSMNYTPSWYQEYTPAIAFDGTNYFVVWGCYDLSAVVGARVSQTGEVLDKTGIIISYADGDWEYEKPSVAFGGGVYLVIWNDFYDYRVLGVRVNTSGIVLDSNPIEIADDVYNGFPSVASDGTNFFVIWCFFDDLINGTRVSNSGIVLDTIPILIDSIGIEQYYLDIVFGGSNYFAVWTDDRNGNDDIYGTRISTNGNVLDPNGISISTAVGTQGGPSITFGGNNYFVVWEDYRSGTSRDIYGARVNQAGTVFDPSGIPISTAVNSQYFPSVAFDGINYFAVWYDRRSSYDIYGARISTAGIVLDINGIEICTTSSRLPAIASGSSNCLIVWEDGRYDGDIYGTRVNTSGTVLDPAGILITMQCNDQYNPKIASDGSNYFVVWVDERSREYDIYGARVNANGVILDPGGIPISTAVNIQFDVEVIFGGSNYFVVWEDWRNGNLDIYGTRINTAGIVLDPSGISISNAVNDQSNPQVIFAGNNYFVAWQDWRSSAGSDIYGARINTLGIVLDPSGIPISTASNDQSYFQIVFGGNNYFLVWQDLRAGNWDIYGARVNMSGTVLDPSSILISTTTDNQGQPRVAFDGLNYLVVWDDYRPAGLDVYGARVSSSGLVLDPAGIPISTTINNQVAPRLAFDGTNFLVVWQDARNGPLDIYGTRISTSGTVLDPLGIAISTANDDQYEPNIIFDGSDYIVVWKDERNIESLDDIYGAKVTKTGIVTEFVVSTMPRDQWNLTLAKGSGNQVLIVWQVWTSIPYNAYRIWGKLLPEQLSGWQTMASVPLSASGKKPKSGSCMTGLQETGKIYFLKASNTQDFHIYTPEAGLGSWTDAETIPKGDKATGDGKKPKRGAAMTAYENAIYVLRGNNTLGFWKYDAIGTLGWQKLQNITPGMKKCKYGSGLVTVTKGGKDYIFAMKGSKTSEFYLYDISGDSWIRVKDVPIGTSSKLGYKKGSCLCYDGNELVYVLQGYYGSFFSYNLSGDSWHQLKQYNYKMMLNRDGKKKKPKDGASLVYCFNNIYLLKGGNTNEVWRYSIAADTWYQLNPEEIWDIPFGISNKKVKDGGCMIMFGDCFYAAKGKNTNEFYRHSLPSKNDEFPSNIMISEGTMNNQLSVIKSEVTVLPNPVTNKLTVKYSLSLPSEVNIKLYNATGELIKSYTNSISTTHGIFHIDTKTLSSGVYILRLVSDDYQTSRKVIIQK